MSSRSINDTSKAVRMTIISDATNRSIISVASRGVIYDRNIFIIQAPGGANPDL
jgi:hypothetical protein